MKKCPFWDEITKCSIRYCTVRPTKNVPEGMRRSGEALDRNMSNVSRKKCCCCEQEKLGILNTALSRKSKSTIKKWAARDSVEDGFCELDEENDQDSQYVDLVLNPEGYTGYAGPSAYRVWRSIY